MRKIALLLTLVLLAFTATALAATKNGITPVAPKAGASVPSGESPTFRMKVTGPGPVWVHVCKRPNRRADGTICSKESIGQARARSKGGEFRYTPKDRKSTRL